MTEPAPSPSTQRFRSHPIHAVLAQWIEKLPDEKPGEYRDLEVHPRDAYVRLRWVLRDLQTRLDALNPMLVPPAALDTMNKQLAQLQSLWEQYKNSPAAQWQPLVNWTDAFVNEMRGLPPSTGADAWLESLEELRDDMNNAIADAQARVTGVQRAAADIDAKFKAANDQLDALTAEIQTQKTRLDQMLTQHTEAFTKSEQDRGAQFTKSEQNRAAHFTEAQDQRKNAFETLMAECEQSRVDATTQHQEMLKQHGEEFRAAQSEMRTQFNAIIGEFNTTTTELVDAQKEKMDSVVAEATATAESLYEQISDQLDKAVEIVGTIVKTTMSGNYQIIANREYRNAWAMRWIAIASFLLMGGMVIWAVWSMHFSEEGVDWGAFAFRLSLGFAFLIPGIYCARESGRHWSAEKRNRRISLELAALDPFLVKLDEEKQKEIIAKMANEYFGQSAGSGEHDDIAGLKHFHIRGDQLFKLAEQIVKIARGR